MSHAAPTRTPSRQASAPHATAAASSLFEEERAKDLALVRHTGKNRARITLLLAAVFSLASLLGVVEVAIPVTLSMCAVALAANMMVRWVSERRYLRGWRYVAATLDSVLISGMIFVAGKPMMVAIYFLSIVPYALDRGAAVGQVATFTSVVGFLLAQWLHWDVYLGVPTPWSDVLLAALLLLLAAQQAIVIPARLERRMRRAREQMAKVEQGDLLARMSARHDDELGFLERSLNRMLDELTAVIETAQREAEALVRVAGELEVNMEALRGRSGELAGGALLLSTEVARQLVAVREGMLVGQEATRTAGDARALARANRAAAQLMLSSREAIDEAAQMLLEAGGSVEAAAERVQRLGPASEQVGEFVARVARIARQTNLLALNAAIEAARAGEEGAGFAVVADEIRALATESAQASKLIAATVQRVREEMAEAMRAMEDTTSGLSGARMIAQESRQALTTMVEGLAKVAERADQVTLLSEEQEARSRQVAATFDALEEVSQRANVEARRAADGTAGQQVSFEALAASAAQLSASAQRLRVVGRADWYQVMRAEAATVTTAPQGALAVPGGATPPRPMVASELVATVTPLRPTPLRPAVAIAPAAVSKAG